MFEGKGANQSMIASTTRIFNSLYGHFSNKFWLALNFTINSTKSFTNLPEFFRSVSFPDSEGTKQQNMVIMQCNRRMQVKGEGKKSTLIVHLIRSSLISENNMFLFVNRKTRLKIHERQCTYKIIAKNCQRTRKGTQKVYSVKVWNANKLQWTQRNLKELSFRKNS